jgi:YegS/Rv2252/BmrU family lipid kinase
MQYMKNRKSIHLTIATFNEINGAQNALTQIRKGHAIVGVKAAVMVQKDHANILSVKDIGLTPKKGAFGGVVLGSVVGLLTGGAGLALGVLGGLLGALSIRKTQKSHLVPELKSQLQELIVPGSSAILIVGDRPLPDDKAAELEALGGLLYITEITPDTLEQLQSYDEDTYQTLTDELQASVETIDPTRPPYPSIYLVLNPAAGGDEPIINTINDVFRPYGIQWDVGITHKYGDAQELTRKAAKAGYDLVAGYGGDGTQHEIANGLMGTGVTMGVLPGGTGNGFCRELGLPNKLEPALELLTTSRAVRNVDIVSFEDEYFIQRLYVGIEPESQTSREMKDKYGTMAYAVSGYQRLKTHQDIQYRITIDGEVIETKATKVYVVNASQSGTGISVTGDLSSSNDGLLEVFVLDREDLKTISAAAERMLNLHTQIAGQYFWRGKEINIDTEPDQPVWTDGEYQGRTPVSMKVIPGGLPIVVTP